MLIFTASEIPDPETTRNGLRSLHLIQHNLADPDSGTMGQREGPLCDFSRLSCGASGPSCSSGESLHVGGLSSTNTQCSNPQTNSGDCQHSREGRNPERE